MPLGTARGGNFFKRDCYYFVPWYKIAHSGNEKLEVHHWRNNSFPLGSFSNRKSFMAVWTGLPQSTSVRCCMFSVWWYSFLVVLVRLLQLSMLNGISTQFDDICYLPIISIFNLLFASLLSIFIFLKKILI